jgi:steroid 5-alpha reductase family enzyme
VGAEDYRWQVIRGHRLYPRLLPFWVFDLVVIAVFQNLLLFLITTPAYVLTLSSTLPPAAAAWSTVDTVVSRLLPTLLALEALADQQQWSYQGAKRSYLESGGEKVLQGFAREDLERGFVVSGLWGLSRHPNFFCEQALWIVVYQWTCLVADAVFNWTAIGCALYVLLFQLSTALTEEVTAGKYPEYREYQRLVNRFVPGKSALLGEKGVKEVKKE